MKYVYCCYDGYIPVALFCSSHNAHTFSFVRSIRADSSNTNIHPNDAILLGFDLIFCFAACKNRECLLLLYLSMANTIGLMSVDIDVIGRFKMWHRFLYERRAYFWIVVKKIYMKWNDIDNNHWLLLLLRQEKIFSNLVHSWINWMLNPCLFV